MTNIIKCEYDLDVTLNSAFAVNAVERFGEKHGVGSLANSFLLTLGGASSNKGRFIMGSRMDVEIEWLLEGMGDLSFKITSCSVSHGDVELPIVQDECYADVIEAEPLEGATRSRQGLAYNIFKTTGAAGFTQHITCGVRVCTGQCERRSDNHGCDQGTLMGYSFREIDAV